MDSTRFDEVAKRLATSRSRRTVLRGLGRGMAAGAIGAFAVTRLQPASAAPAARPEGHPCEGNQVCADGLVCVASGPGQSKRCTDCGEGWTAYGDNCYQCGLLGDLDFTGPEPVCVVESDSGGKDGGAIILQPTRKY